ncbi:uncharacterized protein LOC144665780 [Oculina patagonica]
MPDRSRERSRERTDRKKISSAVVVSKSFQKAQDKRDPSKERRERRYRQRSPDDVRESDRAVQKLHMDRDENSRERRRQRLSERLGQRTRQSDAHEESEDKEENTSGRWKERNQRYSQRGRGASLTNQQRRTVFDRLDPGPPRDRGFVRNPQGRGGPRDQRTVEVEVEVNPQDVPRGKRYFMHDDRELPRRQKSDRTRARSRSPLWVHDRFGEHDEDEDMEEQAAQDDSETTKEQDSGLNQDRQRDRDRRSRQNLRRN